MTRVDSDAALRRVRKRNKEEKHSRVMYIADEVVKAKRENRSTYGIIPNLIKESQDIYPDIKEHAIQNELRRRKAIDKERESVNPNTTIIESSVETISTHRRISI